MPLLRALALFVLCKLFGVLAMNTEYGNHRFEFETEKIHSDPDRTRYDVLSLLI